MLNFNAVSDANLLAGPCMPSSSARYLAPTEFCWSVFSLALTALKFSARVDIDLPLIRSAVGSIPNVFAAPHLDNRIIANDAKNAPPNSAERLAAGCAS